MSATVAPASAAPPSSTSFRTFLQEELARRCAKNGRYSLRAFAKFLRVDHSTLSQIIRGRRPCSDRTIATLGARLGLAQEAVASFVAAESPGSPPPGDQWIPHAILDLMTLDEFRPDCRRIAAVLGVSLDETVVALDHLIRGGLLVMSAPDRWTRLRDPAPIALTISRPAMPRALQAIARFKAELESLATPGDASADALRIEVELSCHELPPLRGESSHGTPGHQLSDSVA